MGLGWRIRGQFGHEIGAAIPGALGAMAIAMVSGREDWRRRIHFFGMFGALGWAFGGSMSYMKVVGYSQSSDSSTVLYGFAALMLLGFLWSTFGGAGAALAASMDSGKLADVSRAVAAVLGIWFLQDIGVDLLRRGGGRLPLWLSGDLLPAVTAMTAALALRAVRRQADVGTSLVIHLAAGWYAGLVVLVWWLRLELNPPRGETWACCAGMFAGLMIFCWRQRLREIAATSLIAGFLGGIAFAAGQMVKLAFVSTDVRLSPENVQGGWHAIMEWTHGMFFGMALATAMLPLIRGGAPLDQLPRPKWIQVFAAVFVLWAIPYLNFRLSPERWLRNLDTLPKMPFGIATDGRFLPSRGFIGWIEIVCVPLVLVLVWALLAHLRSPLPLAPTSSLGRAQIFYLTFLWSMTIISFVYTIPEFKPFSWAVQCGMTLNAITCMALAIRTPAGTPDTLEATPRFSWRPGRAVAAGLLGLMATGFAGWGLKRALFGDAFTGFFDVDQIRFGPKNTNSIK